MDRAFRFTFLGSLLGHLIVGSVFTIVVFPTKWAAQPPAAAIRFLGPILLEDVYQKQAQSKEKLLMTSETALDARALKHFELDPEPAGKEIYQNDQN